MKRNYLLLGNHGQHIVETEERCPRKILGIYSGWAAMYDPKYKGPVPRIHQIIRLTEDGLLPD